MKNNIFKKTYPVAVISYVNMFPYMHLGEPEWCNFVLLVPSDSIKAIKFGSVVAASVPVGGLTSLYDLVDTLGEFGISAGEKSMSVLFFSKIPFDSINHKHVVRITSESASSVKLLYLLLGYNNGFDNIPRVSSYGKIFDGELVIGDKALLRCCVNSFAYDFNSDCIWPYSIDLAERWYDVTGYPFVFSRWVIRKDAPDIVKQSMKKWLLKFKECEKDLVKKAVITSADLLKIPYFDIKLYFEVLKRVLGDRDLLGQKLFMEDFEKYRKKPLFGVVD